MLRVTHDTCSHDYVNVSNARGIGLSRYRLHEYLKHLRILWQWKEQYRQQHRQAKGLRMATSRLVSQCFANNEFFKKIDLLAMGVWWQIDHKPPSPFWLKAIRVHTFIDREWMNVVIVVAKNKRNWEPQPKSQRQQMQKWGKPPWGQKFSMVAELVWYALLPNEQYAL